MSFYTLTNALLFLILILMTRSLTFQVKLVKYPGLGFHSRSIDMYEWVKIKILFWNMASSKDLKRFFFLVKLEESIDMLTFKTHFNSLNVHTGQDVHSAQH